LSLIHSGASSVENPIRKRPNGMTPHKKRTKKHKNSFLDSLWIEYKFNMNEEKRIKKVLVRC
jgi:hypothetical protein